MSARQEDPRANQKARTRAAIVEAASELRDADGETPTVARAAEAAGVSRATAYRYFPTQEALAVELADMPALTEATEAALAALDTDDVEERLLRLVDTFNPVVFAAEEPMRQALRVYLDTWLRDARATAEPPALRVGRRMRWLERVLAPTDLPETERRRLMAALALTIGGDSMVIMKDVCGLEDDEALDVLRWAAVVLLRAGLADAPGGAGT